MSKIKVFSLPKFGKSKRISLNALLNKCEKQKEAIIQQSVPNGTYIIRSGYIGLSDIYYVMNNVWYKTNKTNKNLLEFRIQPYLSEKEWDLLDKLPKKVLNNYWRKALDTHKLLMSMKKGTRTIKLLRLKLKKQNEQK